MECEVCKEMYERLDAWYTHSERARGHERRGNLAGAVAERNRAGYVHDDIMRILPHSLSQSETEA